MNEDNLYILRVYGKDRTLIKFGYSSNIKNRLKSYYNSNPLVEIVGTYYRANAKEFELDVHKLIKSDAGSEWYSEDKLDIILGYIKTGIHLDKLPDKVLTMNENREIMLLSYHQLVKLIKKQPTSELESFLESYVNTYPEYIQLVREQLKLNLTLDYNHTRAIKAVANKNKQTIVNQAIKDTFKLNLTYPLSEIKETLKSIYKDYSISNTPKATYLQEVFITKNVLLQVNGKRIKSYKVIDYK